MVDERLIVVQETASHGTAALMMGNPIGGKTPVELEAPKLCAGRQASAQAYRELSSPLRLMRNLHEWLVRAPHAPEADQALDLNVRKGCAARRASCSWIQAPRSGSLAANAAPLLPIAATVAVAIGLFRFVRL